MATDKLTPDVHCAHDAMVDTAALIPQPRNPNKHPDNQIALLAKIIAVQGWRAPITVSNRSNFIVRGHGRLLAAQVLELEQCPVDYQDYESEAEEWADLLADNKIAELAETDFSSLADLLQELDTGDLDMDLTGFDEAEVKRMMEWTPPGVVTEDDFDAESEAEAIVEPITKTGDIWLLGDHHRVMCGDSTKAEDVGKLMGGEKIGLVLTDPPYGVSIVNSNTHRVGGGKIVRMAGRIPKRMPIKRFDEVVGDDSINSAAEMYANLSAFNPGAWIIWGGNYFTDFLPSSRCWIVWDKENTDNFADAELAWCSLDRPIKLYRWLWNGVCRKGDRASEGLSRVHPTQKPVGLHCQILRDFSENDALIFDPFLGSGTTLIAAEQLGRKCYGMEISPKYVDVIVKRWEQLTGKTAVLETRVQAVS